MTLTKNYRLSYIDPATRAFREHVVTAVNADEAVKMMLRRDNVVGEVIVNVEAAWRVKATITVRADLERVP